MQHMDKEGNSSNKGYQPLSKNIPPTEHQTQYLWHTSKVPNEWAVTVHYLKQDI